MRFIYALFILVLFTLVAPSTFAQTKKGDIKGVLLSAETGKPMENATINLLQTKDSSTVGFKMTDKGGQFSFPGIPYGSYYLLITFIGHEVKEFSFELDKPSFSLDSIPLMPAAATLDEVVVNFKKPPIVVKEDTIEFNADSYKVKPESLAEDLLKKLPGMEVDRDGNITAQGQSITKIYVDGKPFFGGDFKMATQNLPADIIDKIQLIDQKSDRARFTRVDDGKREKIINITIKKNKKNGYFGRAAVGAGNEDRYNGTLNLNRFKGDRQLSAFGSANNVNANERGGGGGGNDGLNTVQRLGFNYRNNLNKKLDVASSLGWNNNDAMNIREQARQDLRTDTMTMYNEKSRSQRKSTRYNWEADLTYRPDSMTEMRGRINTSYSDGKNIQASTFERLKEFIGQTSEGFRKNSGNTDNLSFSGEFNYMRRFKKFGRSFTLGLNANNGFNNSESILDYSNVGVTDFNVPFSDVRKQLTNNDSRNNRATLRMSYTEPITKSYMLDFSYDYTLNRDNNNTETFDWDGAHYEEVNDSLTNNFRNRSNTQNASMKFVGIGTFYNYNIGVTMQDIDRENFNMSKETVAQQNFTNFVPSAGITFFNKKGRTANLFYNGTINQPSLQQLQPVPEASNPMYQFLGNPDLINEYTHNLTYKYDEFFRASEISASVNGNFSTVNNKIINYSEWDETGKQFAKPINIDGTWSTGLWANTSIPIIKKVLGVSFNTGMNYNKGKAFIRETVYKDNGGRKDTAMLNTSSSMNFNVSGGLTFEIDELLSFSYRGRMAKNTVKYSDAENMNTVFYNYTHSFDFDVDVPGGIEMKTGIDLRTNKGGTQTFNQSVGLWNAQVSKHFLKRRLFVTLQGYDLLNQNQNVKRTVSANAIVDELTNTLNRYFMATVSYRLNKFGPGGGKKGNRGPGGGGGNRGPGHGGGGFGGQGGGRF